MRKDDDMKVSIKVLLFFLVFWLTVMLVNIFVHELGHAVFMAAFGGWKHNLSYFGGTIATDSALMVDTYQWIDSQGFSPNEFGTEQALQVIEYWGETFPAMRWGVIGGWLGQLILSGILLFLTQTNAFKEGASAFGKLFSLGFIVINLGWMGGNWLLLGMGEPVSSDPVLLINVLLGRDPLKIGLLWIFAVLIVALSAWLGQTFGAEMFAGFGLSPSHSKRLAAIWALTSGLAGLSLRIPILVIAVGFILILVIVVPSVYIHRLQSNADDITFTIPGIVWQNTLVLLVLLFAIIFSNSGFFISGNSQDQIQDNAVFQHYCIETDCIPDELEKWFQDE